MTAPRFAEIESRRPHLLCHALAKLRDARAAGEAVQVALVAALESLASFAGKPSPRTGLDPLFTEEGRWRVALRAWGEAPEPRGARAGQSVDRRRLA